MMKLSKALMLSVSGLIFTSNGSAASMYDSTSFNSPDAITFVHTHTSHPEEILLSSPDLSFPGQPLIFLRHGNNLSQKMEEIKTAATCFVTDTSACSGNEFAGNNADDDGHGGPGGPGNGDDDYDLDNEERCKKEGYTMTSCPEGQEGSNFCPYDSSYFEECVNSCPSNYVTCEKPYYGVGEACDGKYASCEKDTERACQELNPRYVDECGTGQQLSDDRCSYDNTYGTCCNTCAGYDYTTIPEGYVQDGEACTGCDGQKHYKIKPNPCDGFMDCGSMGPDTGAKTCLSGSTTKYSNCKPCPNLGTLTSCPSPFTCTYEDCSGLWYKTGCQSGYDWNQSAKTCTQQCSDNYKYTCTGSHETGGSGSACGGLYKSCICASGYAWSEGKCVIANCQYTGTTHISEKYDECDCTGILTSPPVYSRVITYSSMCITSNGIRGDYRRGVNREQSGKYASREECMADCEYGRSPSGPVNYISTGKSCSFSTKCETAVWGECTGYAQNCNIGDIVYSDGTCASTVVSNKTPIAVVVYKSADGKCAQAMALKSIGNYEWGGYGTDISSLNNFVLDSNAATDTQSCRNTDIIVSAGGKSTYPAAWAAHEYKTVGTNAGDWCLPAAGIMVSIGNTTNTITNTSAILKSLRTVGGEVFDIGNGVIIPKYWTSSERHTIFSWASNGYGNIMALSDDSKEQHYMVRPVLEF